MELTPGTLIQNKYRITRLLGQGGMGSVYEGENTLIKRRIAIKVLHAGIAQQKGVLERFEREAQAAGQIGNDHIIEVLDLGVLDSGDRFMVLEYLEGETLEQRFEREGRLDPEVICPIVRQVLVGLGAAHEVGIIHRDLKPDNIFILKEKAGQKDFVKIIDFGISKFTSAGTDLRMTATGAVMGTPYYMAPEQARGSGDANNKSDLYAIGVILYRGLTGSVPFEGNNFNELLFNIVLAAPEPASSRRPDLNPAFDTIIRKAMAREREYRFQSAAEFIEALDAWVADGRAVVPPPPSLAPPATRPQVDTSGEPTTLVEAGAGANLTTDGTGKGWANSHLDVPIRKSNSRWYIIGGLAGLTLAALALVLGGEGDSATSPRNAATPSQATPTESLSKGQDSAAEENTPGEQSGPKQADTTAATGEEPPADEPKADEPPADEHNAGEPNAGDGTAGAEARDGASEADSVKASDPAPVKVRPVPRPRPRPVQPRPVSAPRPQKKTEPDFGY